MRTLFLISIAAMFFLAGCKKEEEWQTVAITGHYTNVPDPEAGFFTLYLPDGAPIPAPRQYKVSGSDNIIGDIDASKSVLTVDTITPGANFFGFDLVYHITMFNSAGDEVHFKGSAQSYLNYTGLGWVHYTGGTGKFDGISGWENIVITTDPATGVHTITATGEATYKK